ncbi:MAG TPA: hypothetical protein DEA08_26000, partial [Planctomycetes bacterium]|nr:hypothetical protein [Planctomycetota bacterium]
DEAAVAELLDRCWAPAYRVALGATGDPGAAEDVAQEAIVRALQAAERFQPGRPFEPWFLRIVINVARNHRRGEGRRRARESLAARPERLAPDLGVEKREQAEVVQREVARLAPKLREAVTLRYLQELSLKEVARILGCPEGTVSSRVRRGIERLREGLEPSLDLGAVAGLLLLRQALQAPAPEAASALLAQAAGAPLLPEVDEPPEGLFEEVADELAGGALEGAAQAAPPPPPPGEVLELAREVTGDAAQAALESAPEGVLSAAAPVAVLLLLLGLGAGSAALLGGGGAATPASRVAQLDPPAQPSAAGLAGGVALQPELGPPTLALRAPGRLRVGDEVHLSARVGWSGGDAASLDLELVGATGPALSVER